MNKEPKKVFMKRLCGLLLFFFGLGMAVMLCPSLSLLSNSDFILPYFRVCSILLRMLILDRKKAVDKRPL
jgi:hypothetical protein